MKAGWTIWARRRWTDPEPDTFTMSVESSQPDTKRHVVVSGCATWLTAEQAKEVGQFLSQCITLCEEGPQISTDESAYDEQQLSIREMFESERDQCRQFDENGFRVPD